MHYTHKASFSFIIFSFFFNFFFFFAMRDLFIFGCLSSSTSSWWHLGNANGTCFLLFPYS
ncbi:hypothetical protein BCR42DRAFT_52673 [Absidia repens]|uniref:Uncharacterized protein n=1 Tax=Absidia repens TaxID=90262 RepID=A0A1X2IFG1_9FUNG|nr:hypothetical protein BCR42DRAFT_52673 [Absidia repens]